MAFFSTCLVRTEWRSFPRLMAVRTYALFISEITVARIMRTVIAMRGMLRHTAPKNR